MEYIINDELELLDRSKLRIGYAKIISKIGNKYLVEFSENKVNWFKCPYEIDEIILNKYWKKIN